MRRNRKMPKPRGSFLGKWTHGRTLVNGQSFADFDADEEYREGLVSTHDGTYHQPLPGARMSPKSRRVLTFILVAAVLGLGGYFFWGAILGLGLKLQGVPPGLWSEQGKLMVGKDRAFFIKGFSWFGMEEPSHVFGGLAYTTVDEVLGFAQLNDFNAIRVPLAYDNWVHNPEIGAGIDTFMNGDLTVGRGLFYIDLLEKVVAKAAAKDVLIMLDLHRLSARDSKLSGLWYSRAVSEDDVVQFWTQVCRRFGGHWNIFGVDLTNEPYKGVWDDSKSHNNWRRAARRLANVVHNGCPHWLIVVEGVGSAAEKLEDQPFWGENVHAMKHAPLLARLPKKIAISPHVYGPSVYPQPYFNSTNFMKRMPRIWDTHFGNALDFTTSAVIIGEWGGTNVGKDAKWQAGFAKYIQKKGFGFFYWCLNPDSTDTGGLLLKDWRSPDKKKLALLKSFKGTPVKPLRRHFRRRF